MPAKWWGDKSKRPILCLHGCQENAGTFDTLIPLISGQTFLAIDFPGHGHSSHLPAGCFYHLVDRIALIRRIQRYYKWDKISLMGHSSGAVLAFFYSAAFNEDVDFYIALDALKPPAFTSEETLQFVKYASKKFLFEESSTSQGDFFYPRDKMVKQFVDDSYESIDPNSARYLIRRGALERKGKFQWTSDRSIAIPDPAGYTQREMEKMASHLKCKTLILKSKFSPYYDQKSQIYRIIDILRSTVPSFEYHKVDGNHHVHLNNPSNIAQIIQNFLKSNRRNF